MKKRNTILLWVLNAAIITLAIGEAKAGWLTRMVGINRPAPLEQKTERPVPKEQKTEKPVASPAEHK